MAIPKYTLYKFVKVAGTWRYCKAAYHDNGKIKPDIVFVDVKKNLEEKHPEGRYYMSYNGGWINADTDALGGCRREAIFDEESITYRRGSIRNLLILRTGNFHPDRLLEAQRKRKQRLALDEFNRLSGKVSAQTSCAVPGTASRITLAAAAKNISPIVKPVVLIPRRSAGIGLRLIRLSSIVALRMLTRAGTTSRSCSTIWAGSESSPFPSASTVTPSAPSLTSSRTCAFSSRNSVSRNCSRRMRNRNTTRKRS